MKLPIKKLSEGKNIGWIAVLYTGVITLIFLMTLPETSPSGLSGGDKIVHVLIHLFLIFLWLQYFFIKKDQRLLPKMIFVVFMATVAYGILIEIFQHFFTDSRQADILDVAANTMGALLGLLLFQLNNKPKTKL